jgi:hypothetical protein
MHLNKIELCNTSEVEIGQSLKVEKNGLVLAVFNVEGEFFVTNGKKDSPALGIWISTNEPVCFARVNTPVQCLQG